MNMNCCTIKLNARKPGLGFDSVTVSPFPFKFELRRVLGLARTVTLPRVHLFKNFWGSPENIGLNFSK